MFGIAREVANHAVRFGVARATRYAGWRILDRIAGYVPYQGFVLPASRAHVRSPTAANGFTCREVELAELRAYVNDPAYELSERFLSEARERGDCCIGVFAGERLVSHSFNATKPTNVDSGFRYEFPAGWIYHFKAVTQPEWRGQGLHGRQLPVILRKFSGAPGFQGLTTLVWATNYPSLSSFKRLYFEPAFRFVIAGKGAKRRLIADAPGVVSGADGKLFVRLSGSDEMFSVIRLERA